MAKANTKKPASKRAPAGRTPAKRVPVGGRREIGDGLTWFGVSDDRYEGYGLAIDNSGKLIARDADGDRLASIPKDLMNSPEAAELVAGIEWLTSLPRPERAGPAIERLALDFTNDLARRKYAAAHARLSRSCRDAMTRADMQRSFECLLEADDGRVVGKIRLVQADVHGDRFTAYVSLGGENNEGIFLTVVTEDDVLRISNVQWGRP